MHIDVCVIAFSISFGASLSCVGLQCVGNRVCVSFDLYFGILFPFMKTRNFGKILKIKITSILIFN